MKMIMTGIRAAQAIVVLLFISAIFAAQAASSITPTVFMVEKDGQLHQLVRVSFSPAFSVGAYSSVSEQAGLRIEENIILSASADSISVHVPACEQSVCKTGIEIKDERGNSVFHENFDLPYQRRWKVYLSPFSHVDVGFTNSQRKILAQNIDNLRAVLTLLRATSDYPEPARFKFFTEVTWPLYEFLYGEATTADEKADMIAGLRSGQIEIGGFLISHQNKFMPAEALFRSTDFALKINRDYGVPVKTACLNDLMDFSSIVKPLHAACINYFIGGANTAHYITPPLFYLMPPVGDEKILCWLTPNLSGYLEDFDLAMQPDTPISEDALKEIEKRLGAQLQGLESAGAPLLSVAAHYDFYGAQWPYPYDMYFLPYYPPHAVDNGPQDITVSDMVKAWNARYAYPKMIIANPSEFFAEAQSRFDTQIPTLRGELPGFWGEQVFFAFAQTDPEKERIQREFESESITYEIAASLAMLTGEMIPDLSREISEGYKLIALNNDHNPGPVPFGNTSYTKDDVEEWKRTRQEWISRIEEIDNKCFNAQLYHDFSDNSNSSDIHNMQPTAIDNGNIVILENDFYKVLIDKKSGGIASLYDKELSKELTGRDGEYLLNQYVVVARGENAGWRGKLFSRPGFENVQTDINVDEQGYAASVEINGRLASTHNAAKVLTEFIKKNFGITLPSSLITLAARIFGIETGPVEEVSQYIALPRDEKMVLFFQHIKADKDQIIDHCFAYPLNVPKDRPLIIGGPYSSYKFAAVPPFGNGDLIPAAAMMDTKFKGINALTQVFSWIRDLPADAVFQSYVLALGDGYGIAFSSGDSGAILTGPMDNDPLHGPFGGVFYHLGLGWTAYGKAFLGAEKQVDTFIGSSLTSFKAENENQARENASYIASSNSSSFWKDVVDKAFSSSQPEILLASMKPLDNRSILIRLYDAGDLGGETEITLKAADNIISATRARSDGQALPGGELKCRGNSFGIKLGPGEVASVRVEVK